MHSVPQHPNSLRSGHVVDGYRVVRRLGTGGFGTVFLVEKAGRRFAMKFAHHRADSKKDMSQADARARRELMCLLWVHHPNVVGVHGHGHWPRPESGWIYVLLEYVDGYTLANWVRKTHPSPAECVRLFSRLFAALAHLHSNGIFHRDLKVTNILVRKNGEPVIIDFGAGDHASAGDLTDSLLPPGTDRYRSPEAARFFYANKLDGEARYEFKETDEIYALGLCLFDVLTSPVPEHWQVPIPLKTVAPAPAPHKVNPRVPETLSELVMGLTASDPERRPPTAEAARRGLEGLLPAEGEAWTAAVHQLEDVMEAEKKCTTVVPFPSLPVPEEEAPEPPRRWRRGRLSVGIAAMGVLLAVLTVLLFAWWEAPSPVSKSAPELARPLRTDTQSAKVPPPSMPLLAPLPLAPAPIPAPKEGSDVNSQPVVEDRSTAEARGRNAQPEVAGSGSIAASITKGRLPRLAEFIKKCAMATGLVAVQLGCTGGGQSQLRPAPAECPSEARSMMFDYDVQGGLKVGVLSSVVISLDRNRRGSQSRTNVYGDGPVEGYVERGHGGLVEGSIVYGQLWTGTGAMVFRYTVAQLPNGQRVPVCLASGATTSEVMSGVSVPGLPASKPGAVVFGRSAPAFFVERWP